MHFTKLSQVYDPFEKRWIVRFERTHLSDLAARAWYTTVREQILSQGFIQGFAKGSPSANLNKINIFAEAISELSVHVLQTNLNQERIQ